MNKEKPHKWQAVVGAIGFLIWLISLQISEFLSSNYPSVHTLIAGYSLGFITAFAGFAFRDLLLGKISRHIDNHPIFRWFSYASISLVMLLGLLTLLSQIFGNTSGTFVLGSIIGGFVVTIGVIPSIEYLDKSAQRS